VYSEPRGLGLLVALPVKAPYEAKELVAKMRENGVLAGIAGGNVIRIAPPLIITSEQIRQLLTTLDTIAA
jgi:acetylornithine/succinyldiaminopimelate/putrescine aminotransferase